jgi:uncharacterized membrane protein
MNKIRYLFYVMLAFILLTPSVLATENPHLQYVSCGNTTGIPAPIPQLTSIIFTLLIVVTPIIMIIFSIITLTKAIAAQKADEITKARNSIIRKVIATMLVFLVAGITQFVITQAASSSESGTLTSCLSCFLYNANCEPYTMDWS